MPTSSSCSGSCLVGVNPAMDGMKDQAAGVHAAAQQLAIEHGRSLAARRDVQRALR